MKAHGPQAELFNLYNELSQPEQCADCKARLDALDLTEHLRIPVMADS